MVEVIQGTGVEVTALRHGDISTDLEEAMALKEVAMVALQDPIEVHQ